MMSVRFLAPLLAATALAGPAFAQEGGHDHGAADHAQMDHAQMDHGDETAPATADAHAGHEAGTSVSAISLMTKASYVDCPASGDDDMLAHCSTPPRFGEGSGTARVPGLEGAMHGLHLPAGEDWMLMAHGFVTATYTDHKGPRGDDLLYSTSMLMLSGTREFTGGRLALRSMMSLEPTMSARGYPNLFATGETAGGEPLVDRQHPHDLFMELAARLDIDIGERASLFLYGGPVGEPSIGPSAFMHRGSSRHNPEPPISHHWFDSTHITYGVLTAGIATPLVQIEGSVFRGREPDEERWGIETPSLDSWSARVTLSPTPNWTAQLSHAFIKAPEAMHAGQDEHRTTASVHYASNDNRLSATAAFSAKDRSPGDVLSAWLFEANYDLSDHHSLFGRAEVVRNDELVPDHDDPLHDQPFRIAKFQGGYAWRTPLGQGPFGLTLGGSVNLYAKPAALDAVYGRNPWGYSLFARLSLEG